MATNPNGSPTFKATKNPGKLNTSMWETKPSNDADDKSKKGPPKKRKVKKSKMTAMWENKFEERQKEIEASSVTVSKGKRRSSKLKSQNNGNALIDLQKENISNDTNNDKDNKDDDNDTNDKSTATNDDPSSQSQSQSEPKPQPTTESNGSGTPKAVKKNNRVSALAGKLNINPMGLRGGLPPHLRKKRDESKDDSKDISDQQFYRPIIPTSRRSKATKKDIVSIINEKISERLVSCLSEHFVLDETMIISPNILCLFLKDFIGIDLSATDENQWEMELLEKSIESVFGEKARRNYGYQLRVV